MPLFVALLGVCLSLSGCIAAADAVAPNAEEMEGSSSAVSALALTNPATNGEIEGYASAVSLNRGEDIKLYVSTREPTYTISVLRIGWFGGRGMKEMMPAITRHGLAQARPMLDSASGLIECDWEDPYNLHVPASSDPTIWPSGILRRKTDDWNNRQAKLYYFSWCGDDKRTSRFVVPIQRNDIRGLQRLGRQVAVFKTSRVESFL